MAFTVTTDKYQCGRCAHRFEGDERYEEDPKKRNCPKCKKAKGNVLYLGKKAWMSPCISDKLWDVKNPVDGKVYDSKSQYYKKLKETGHHVYEGAGNPNKPLNRGDHNVFKELKAAAIQHGL